MIRLIVTGLDGTLLNHDKIVTPSEKQALLAAKANGVEWCFASGRVHADIRNVMDMIGLATHSISQNGAVVRAKDGACLHAAAFDSRTVKRMYEIAEPFPVVQVACTPEAHYVACRDSASERIQARMFSGFTVRPDLREAVGTELKVSMLSIFGGEGHLGELRSRLETELAQESAMMFLADSDRLDLAPPGVSKGTGLRILCQAMGIKPEEVVCIGGNLNDIPMLRFTPNSFAIKGSHGDVLAAARHSVASVAEAVCWALKWNRCSFIYRNLRFKT